MTPFRGSSVQITRADHECPAAPPDRMGITVAVGADFTSGQRKAGTRVAVMETGRKRPPASRDARVT